MKRFALIGAAGYIAPRHMRAIKHSGNTLVAALDKSDSVGVIDTYFPEADFFTEFERFDRHIEKLRRRPGMGIDYVSICSPNYLHDAHIRFALRVGADAICEKPLVLNPWNVDALAAIEAQSGKKVYNILQLRLHRSIVALKEQIRRSPHDKKHDVDLTYVTPRGRWYRFSWKGDPRKSGGIATNIGIHFFDMLIWVFGAVQDIRVHVCQPGRAAGFLELERARVRWFLSIESDDVPLDAAARHARSHRCLDMDGCRIGFSDGFEELHNHCYAEILAGGGFGLEAARPSIEAAYSIRNAEPIGLKGDYHPLLGCSKARRGGLEAVQAR